MTFWAVVLASFLGVLAAIIFLVFGLLALFVAAAKVPENEPGHEHGRPMTSV
jgi:hypothetical protein